MLSTIEPLKRELTACDVYPLVSMAYMRIFEELVMRDRREHAKKSSELLDQTEMSPQTLEMVRLIPDYALRLIRSKDPDGEFRPLDFEVTSLRHALREVESKRDLEWSQRPDLNTDRIYGWAALVLDDGSGFDYADSHRSLDAGDFVFVADAFAACPLRVTSASMIQCSFLVSIDLAVS